MRLPSYLSRNRFGVFYFRRAVPLALRPHIGRREIVRSMRTHDPKTAIRLSRLVTLHVDSLFGYWSEEMKKKKKSRDLLQSDFVIKFDGEGLFSMELTPEEFKIALDNPDGATKLVTGIAKSAPPGRAITTGVQSVLQKEPCTLFQLITKFEADRADQNGTSWTSPPGDETKFRRLREILGDVPVDSIRHEHAMEVRQTLQKLPANSARYKDKKLTVKELLRTTHEICLSPKSMNDHLDLYRRLFKFAIKRGYTSNPNPFEDIHVKDPTPRHEKRSAFSKSDLEAIFGGTPFTAFDPGKHKPHEYWAPLIALFTGARNAEIGALEPGDIHEISDPSLPEPVWVIDINTNTELKRVKTKNSVRKVPIHPKLIELGIIKFKTALESNGKTRLFDYLKWTKRDGYGRYIGEDFNSYLKTLGLHESRTKVFYSFRHTMATHLERAGVNDSRIEQLSGRAHEGQRSTGRLHYISPPEAQELAADIRKLTFDAELSAVKPYFEMVK